MAEARLGRVIEQERPVHPRVPAGPAHLLRGRPLRRHVASSDSLGQPLAQSRPATLVAAKPSRPPWPLLLDNPLARLQAKRFLQRLQVKPGMRILDLGCGPGRLTVPAARLVGGAGEVLALDLQPAMLAIVERRARDAGLQAIVHTLASSAGSGALPTHSYDLALLVAVLPEIPAEARRATIQENAAALHSGGRLAVVEGLFDPHRQSREAVLALAEPEGLSLEKEDRRLLTPLSVFNKVAAG